jgi:excinuclease ABC subunit C
MIHSSLEGIDGVGAKSIEALFKHFKTLSKIKGATVDELAEVVGRARAVKILEHYNK